MHFSTRQVNLPEDRFPFSHASMLQLSPEGTLACVWFSGSLEGHSDVVARMARLQPAGAWSGPAWEAAQTIAEQPGSAIGNPVLQTDREGKWRLYHVAFPPRQARLTKLHVCVSTNGGDTWSDAVDLPSAPGYWPRHPLVELDRSLLFPLCNIAMRPPRSMIWRSEDGGASWTEIAIPNSEHLIQPALIVTPRGELHCLLRDMREKHIFRSRSRDGGRSWSEPEAMQQPNNNAGVAASTLRSGRIALVYNDLARRDRRSAVRIALSDDSGETWPHQRTILPYYEIPAAHVQYSYPSIVQTPDDALHISLTWRARQIGHVTLDEEWVIAGDPQLAVSAAPPDAPNLMIRTLRPGETVYLADKRVELVTAPQSLIGALAICPLNTRLQREGRRRERDLVFELHRAAEVIVAFDERATPPHWLAEWSPYPGRVETNVSRHRLFSRRLPPGRHRLGANAAEPAAPGHAMYFAFLLPLEQ